ncbi:MAG: hypothetical protein H6868_02040 [Rhodospirillales bacterium]|nr:hypothetical protein [Rhodospirillales bacterium]
MEKNELREQDIAMLALELVVPLVVGDILDGREAFDEVAEYTLHEMIGEMAPDTALLCLSLSAGVVARHYRDIPLCGALVKETDRIIEEYAALWIANKNRTASIGDAEIRDLLVYIPEDLEAIADILDAAQPMIMRQNDTAGILCELLSLQALAHSEAAQIRLEEINLPALSRNPEKVADNVIPFPGTRR